MMTSIIRFNGRGITGDPESMGGYISTNGREFVGEPGATPTTNPTRHGGMSTPPPVPVTATLAYVVADAWSDLQAPASPRPDSGQRSEEWRALHTIAE